MKEQTKDAAHPRRHTQLAEFIDSESSSTLMGGDKQLSEFINSESHSQRGGDRYLSQFINSESASCAKNVAEVVNKERGKEKENLSPTPPIREKENRTRTRTGSGTGTDARGGTGTVGFRQMKGSGTVRIGRDFFFDPRFDPVQIALLGLGIPQRSAATLDALDGYPELQRTLRAIRRHHRRSEIAAALRIPTETYAKRFTRICQILAPMLA